MAQQRLKTELAADLDRARARIARSVDSLKYDLDVPRHVKSGVRSSIAHHKVAILGGATFLGLLLGKLPPRKKKVYVDRKSKETIKTAEKAGLGLIILQFVFKAVRPFLVSLFQKKLGDFARHRVAAAREAR